MDERIHFGAVFFAGYFGCLNASSSCLHPYYSTQKRNAMTFASICDIVCQSRCCSEYLYNVSWRGIWQNESPALFPKLA